MARWSFWTTLVRPQGVGTWTYAPILFDVAAETGVRARLRVKGTIDAVPFKGMLMPMGSGKHFIVVNGELRERIGKSAGDKVKLEMDVDSSPVRVTVPRDLTRALVRKRTARAAFDAMAPSHRKAYVRWIQEARTPETRSRRITEAVELIAAGKHL